MSTIRKGLTLALLVGASACYQESAYAQGSPTMPQPDPQTMQGPPGGQIDPGYGYPAEQVPQQPVDPNAPAGYADPNAGQPQADPNDPYAQQVDPNAGQAQVDPNAQVPADDPNYGTEPVTDATIDATLDGYGNWVDNEDYGRVWVPDATVVGAEFTPYESDGSWAYSDAGWMYNCDFSWGWLPFHYGRWGWFDGYWGWVPGYNWGPAWVDWRYGGGYIGWRPLAPEFRNGRNYQVRDHRHEARVMDSHWRFAAEHDFARPHIASHTFRNPSEGLRVTQPMRPPTPAGVRPAHSAALMQAHMPPRQMYPGTQHAISPGMRPAGTPPHVMGTAPGTRPVPQRTWQTPQRTWQAPQAPQHAYQPPQQTWRAPQAPPSTYRPPVQSYRPPAPSYRPSYNAPAYRPSYNAPSRPSYNPPAYRPSYNAPSRPSYSAPSRPSYSAPSHSSYSAPSHSSYSAPSHSSGGGGGGGGYHGGGGGGGGGGHHR